MRSTTRSFCAMYAQSQYRCHQNRKKIISAPNKTLCYNTNFSCGDEHFHVQDFYLGALYSGLCQLLCRVVRSFAVANRCINIVIILRKMFTVNVLVDKRGSGYFFQTNKIIERSCTRGECSYQAATRVLRLLNAHMETNR